MKKIIILTILITVAGTAQVHSAKFWIYFTAKDQSVLRENGLQKRYAESIGISDRAIHRREKMKTPVITEEDLPVSPSYVSQIRQRGIRIENTLRWFNAVTAYLTPQQADDIAALPFVSSVVPVKTFAVRNPSVAEESFSRRLRKSTTDRYDYGTSVTQMQSINAVAVHNIGISGRGVLVGMLDDGFRWKEHPALKNSSVVAEYDFIQKDSVTANQAGDRGDQDWHGTYTMSVLGGFENGELIGPAFNARFILGKTEYVPSETNVEEDNWAAAIEWMEQKGVDVVSSSLGYNTFDPTDSNGVPQYSYTYQDMNGRTAVTTKAAVIAARKGVVVVNAMGNEANNSWHYLITPADADSIISVGAVDSTGKYAYFSSVGPTSDGRTKPDVAADGVSVYGASTYGINNSKSPMYEHASGTSAATPLVAGAAAMVLSAHPELTPIQVREALRNTASNTTSPNDSIGWGIIDAYKAVLYNGMVISTDPTISLNEDNTYRVHVFVVSHHHIDNDSVNIYYSTNGGTSYSPATMTLTDTLDASTRSGEYSATLPGVTFGTNVNYYIRAMDDAPLVRTTPYDAPGSVFYINSETTGIVTSRQTPDNFVLYQNYPNPFNPTTVIEYSLPAPDHITLTVYDVLGRRVRVLVDGVRPKGKGSAVFDASTLSSGVYIYRLQATTFSETKKMMLLK